MRNIKLAVSLAILFPFILSCTTSMMANSQGDGQSRAAASSSESALPDVPALEKKCLKMFDRARSRNTYHPVEMGPTVCSRIKRESDLTCVKGFTDYGKAESVSSQQLITGCNL